jgi:[acyl-carrier-protein] S-malonyltransferase
MADALVENFQTAEEVVDEIESAISYEILSIMKTGPIEELTKTNNAQIAIFAMSIVILRVLATDFGFDVGNIGITKYMAGHSLGEYTALCASGALPLHEAAKLVMARGRIMSKFSNDENLGMVAIIGVPFEELREIVTNNCVIANDNSDVQVVISGLDSEIEIVSSRARAIGAKKIIRLNTAGAFHSPFMVEANRRFIGEALSKLNLSDPCVPIIMNATALPVSNAEGMYGPLAAQMVSTVKWRSTIDYMVTSGVDTVIEIGYGGILTNISKRSYPNVKMLCLGTIADIEEFMMKDS